MGTAHKQRLTQATCYASGGVYGEGLAAAFFGGMTTGFVNGYIQTGSFDGAMRGAVMGGLSATMFYGAGSGFDPGFGKVVAHGMAGGLMAEMQGGDFGQGFMSAAVTQAVAPGIDGIGNDFGQVAAAAMVGGTVSKINGGKFANGAMTGAFSRMFNDLMHEFSMEESLGRLAKGSEKAREILSTLSKSDRSWVIKEGGELDGASVHMGKTKPLADGSSVIVVDKNDVGKFGVYARDGSIIPLTVDRALAHELAHAYVIENKGYSAARHSMNMRKAVEIENIIMRQMNPRAKERRMLGDGHSYTTLR